MCIFVCTSIDANVQFLDVGMWMVSAAQFYGVIHASGIPLLCLWFEVFFDFVLFFHGFFNEFQWNTTEFP